AWPATGRERRFAICHYWWQAHLLDCLVDAQLRDPQPDRLKRINRQIRGHRLRNMGRWTNDYYDDMAWLALALERSGRLTGVGRPKALDTLAGPPPAEDAAERLAEDGRPMALLPPAGPRFAAWVHDAGSASPWRSQHQVFRAAAHDRADVAPEPQGRHPRYGELGDEFH